MSDAARPESNEPQETIEYEDWYDDDGNPNPPITEKILRQVCDIICKDDENVVVAAKRMRKEHDDALRIIAMLVWERGRTCVISAATQQNLPDFELSRTDDVHGAMWVSVNER